MTAVEVDGLARHYGEREALSEVTLSLASGQTLVVFGPNGAGKTTLLRVLATLLRPHAGSVRVFGESLPGDAWAVRGRIGLLGHEPLLYRELTARENLRFHARLHDVAESRVQEVLELVGIERRAEEPLRTLSRGMVQRVAVARAVLHDPELLLLDEPAAGLDSSESLWLAERLRGVRDTGVTILLIDHDMSLVLGLCDQIHVLDFGALIASGPPEAIRGDQRVAAAYLGATHAKADPGQDRHAQDGHPQEAHVKETHA